MKSEWNTSAIANICKVVTDGSHTSPKSVSHGKYMVSVKDFTPYGFDFNGCRQISFADYEKLKSSGCVPQKGDILIGKDGARYFEDIIIYNQDEAPALLSSIAILRCDEEKVIPEYLYYLLKTPSFKKDVKDNYGSGSAIPRIILKDFKRMKVEYPSIEKQRQIVSILHDLDAKIFNNQKVNDNLEQQASAIYQAWFEEFLLSGGSCPSTWKHGILADIANITSGKRPSVKFFEMTENAVIPIVGAASIMGYTSESNHTDKILVTGRVGTHGVIQRFSSPCWTSDNTLVITSDLYEYTYQLLKRIDYHSMNRGSTQPLITQSDMNKVPILIPDSETLNNFELLAGELMEQYQSNLLENRKLAELRDTLLPKLMFGEIDVSNLQL